MDTLFPPRTRDDSGAAFYAESHYSYLQRTARDELGRIRETIDEWFRRYPKDHRHELGRRIQSGDDRNFTSAFFELYLHELLLSIGCRLTVHPETTSDRATRPDFLVVTPGGVEFYLEATEASEKSREEAAAEARTNQVYDVINRLDCPGYSLGVEHHGSPDSQPPARQIRAFLKRKLAALDDETPPGLKDWDGEFDSLPRWPFTWENWQLVFFPIPRTKEPTASGRRRPLGLFLPKMGRRVDPHTPVRKKLVEKSGYYGELSRPLVIAVNCLDLHLERWGVRDVLFGTEGSVVVIPDSNGEPVEFPVLDGFWLGPNGAKNSRVVAVFSAYWILPWTVGSPSHEPRVFHNPWADTSLETELSDLPSESLKLGRLTFTPGTGTRTLLHLPQDYGPNVGS